MRFRRPLRFLLIFNPFPDGESRGTHGKFLTPYTIVIDSWNMDYHQLGYFSYHEVEMLTLSCSIAQFEVFLLKFCCGTKIGKLL